MIEPVAEREREDARPGDALGTLLTSGDVARLLGVAPATLKRWTDAGRLRCVRTAGGHRRFQRDEVERLRVRLGSGRDALTRWVDGLLQDPERALAAALLLERERHGAWWRVADALGPVLDEIGRRWQAGSWCVLEEHVASERLARALARCCEALPFRSDGPRLLLAAAEGDDHTLGLSLVELCVRERGWRPLWAGRSTPRGEIVRAVESGEVDAVALSASVASSAGGLRQEAEEVAAACAAAGAALVLGGSGPWPSPLRHAAVERTMAGLHAWMVAAEPALASRARASGRGGQPAPARSVPLVPVRG